MYLSKEIPFGCDEKIFAVIFLFKKQEYLKDWNKIVQNEREEVIVDRIGVSQSRKMYAMKF